MNSPTPPTTKSSSCALPRGRPGSSAGRSTTRQVPVARASPWRAPCLGGSGDTYIYIKLKPIFQHVVLIYRYIPFDHIIYIYIYIPYRYIYHIVLEVPKIYLPKKKLNFRESPHIFLANNMVLTYLHFKILKFPLIGWFPKVEDITWISIIKRHLTRFSSNVLSCIMYKN